MMMDDGLMGKEFPAIDVLILLALPGFCSKLLIISTGILYLGMEMMMVFYKINMIPVTIITT